MHKHTHLLVARGQTLLRSVQNRVCMATQVYTLIYLLTHTIYTIIHVPAHTLSCPLPTLVVPYDNYTTFPGFEGMQVVPIQNIITTLLHAHSVTCKMHCRHSQFSCSIIKFLPSKSVPQCVLCVGGQIRPV